MLRVCVLPVVALLGVVIPSVAHAQYAVVSPCGYDCARISVIPAPPTGVPVWLEPTPVAPSPLPPLPVYVAPPPTRGGGIDPWIPLAGRPAPARSGDLLNQLLLLEALAARPRPQVAPAPVVPMPAPRPAPVPGENWMSAYIKGVK